MRLNTDLGQHFLKDQAILDAIVEAAHIEPSDHIVEIGPGIGVLTDELVSRARIVTAIELDERLPSLLKAYTGYPQNLTILQQNALKTEMPSEPYKIVANIPYHITSPLLRHVFLESKMHPVSLTLLIQREVAERICDRKNAGLLTILVQLFGTPQIITLVPPSCFLPKPKVDSAVLHIDCFQKPITTSENIDAIFTLTKVAFGQKRKMLSNTLGALPGGTEAMQKASIETTRRPQTLSIQEWIRALPGRQ